MLLISFVFTIHWTSATLLLYLNNICTTAKITDIYIVFFTRIRFNRFWNPSVLPVSCFCSHKSNCRAKKGTMKMQTQFHRQQLYQNVENNYFQLKKRISKWFSWNALSVSKAINFRRKCSSFWCWNNFSDFFSFFPFVIVVVVFCYCFSFDSSFRQLLPLIRVYIAFTHI